MRSSYAVVLAGVFMLTVNLEKATAAGRTLVKNGKSDYVIVVADSPAPLVSHIHVGKSGYPGYVFPDKKERTVLYAAEEMQRVLFEVTGVKIPIVRDGEKISSRAGRLFVGSGSGAANLGLTAESLRPEGYYLKTGPSWAAVIGEVAEDGTDRGTIFGVYDFLERVTGARWYFPGEMGTVIPKKKNIVLPLLDEKVEPAFKMRVDGGLGKYSWLEWFPALRHGGTSKLYVNHTMNSWGIYFGESHPEYFAIQADGSRRISRSYSNRDNHICYSQPGVLRQEIENLEKWFNEGKRFWENKALLPNETYSYFCPNDVMTMWGICYCDDCMSLWRPETPSGQHSELILGYAARLAREIDKRWPGRRLAAAAYEGYENAPEGIDIPDNLDIMTCQVRGPVMQVNPDIYESEKKALEKWFNLLNRDRNRLAVWHYFCYPNMFSNAPMLAARTLTRWHRENRHMVSGLFNNGLSWRQSPGHELNYFMIWLWHKVLWNPDEDPDVLTEDFCINMFGPAAKPMLAFFRLEIDRFEDAAWGEPAYGSYIPERVIYRDIYPEEVVAELKNLLSDAEHLTEEGSIYRKRIEWYKDLHGVFFEESMLFNKWYRSPIHVEIPKVTQEEGWWTELNSYRIVEQIFGKAPSSETEIYFGHTGDRLLVHAVLHDTAGAEALKSVTSGDREQDERIRNDDSLQICFDLNSRAYYHSLQFNSAGYSLAGIESPAIYIRGKHLPGLFKDWNITARPVSRTKKEKDKWVLDVEIPMTVFSPWGIDKNLYNRGLRIQIRRFKKTPPGERTALSPFLQQEWEVPIARFGTAVFKK
jgi:hypothetical protein